MPTTHAKSVNTMAFATAINCDVRTIQKSSTTKQTPPENLGGARTAIARARRVLSSEDGGLPMELAATKLGEGGYNEVFLITSEADLKHFNVMEPFVLRLPKGDVLLPYQVVNEVNCISMISSCCPDIPVPTVYAFSSDLLSPFIAEEYIAGDVLSSSWNRYTEDEKRHVAQQIADIVVTMGEMRFDYIGSFTGGPFSLLGPTVEGSKLFKGRSKFHSKECYHIGPYKSTKEYVLACYDKEIYYYTHAPASDIDFALFKKTSLEQFVQQLRVKRKLLETSFVAANEPFVLVHGDFNGRNIMMRGLKVVAVLDWEFSGAYPLSELVAGGVGIDVVETVDDDSEEENSKWSWRIMSMAAATARKRGWPEREVELQIGNGDPVVGFARTEMF